MINREQEKRENLPGITFNQLTWYNPAAINLAPSTGKYKPNTKRTALTTTPHTNTYISEQGKHSRYTKTNTYLLKLSPSSGQMPKSNDTKIINYLNVNHFIKTTYTCPSSIPNNIKPQTISAHTKAQEHSLTKQTHKKQEK